MKCLHDKFPKLQVVLDLPYHPNAISLNNRIKESLRECVKYRFNDLVSFIDEKELVDKITVIYNTLL